MDDLVTFLRARLDEDERVARAASPGPWTISLGPYEGDLEIRAAGGAGIADTEGGAIPPNTPDAEHICLHHPARVLREVEAKRETLDAVLALERPTRGGYQPRDRSGKPQTWVRARPIGPDPRQPLLRLLALPYADHPDWHEEWRP